MSLVILANCRLYGTTPWPLSVLSAADLHALGPIANKCALQSKPKGLDITLAMEASSTNRISYDAVIKQMLLSPRFKKSHPYGSAKTFLQQLYKTLLHQNDAQAKASAKAFMKDYRATGGMLGYEKILDIFVPSPAFQVSEFANPAALPSAPWPKLDPRIGTVVTGNSSDSNFYTYPVYVQQPNSLRTRIYGGFKDAVHLGFQMLETGHLSAGDCKGKVYTPLEASFETPCAKALNPSPDPKDPSTLTLKSVPLDMKLIPSLADFARADYIHGLISQDIKTIVLNATPAHPLSANNFLVNKLASTYGTMLDKENLIIPRALEATTNEFYHLTMELLTRYAGTDKEIILSSENEMDWALKEANAEADRLKLSSPPDCQSTDAMKMYPKVCATVKNIISYWNAVQDGVYLARQANPGARVRVSHSCELNLILKSVPNLPPDGRPNPDYRLNGVSVVRNVVPYTHCDYYGYSAYDYGSVEKFGAAIEFLKASIAKNGSSSRFFISELGVSENAPVTSYGGDVAGFVDSAIKVAFERGATRFVHWSLYDNGCVWKSSDGFAPNTALSKTDPVPRVYCAGAWIRKPNGDLSKIFNMLQISSRAKISELQTKPEEING